MTSSPSTTGGDGIRRLAISVPERSSSSGNTQHWPLNPGVHETGASPGHIGFGFYGHGFGSSCTGGRRDTQTEHIRWSSSAFVASEWSPESEPHPVGGASA